MSQEWDEIGKSFSALSSVRRLQILEYLSHHPRCGEELASELGISAATVTHHLEILERGQLILRSHQRHYQIVQMRSDKLLELAQLLSHIATRPSASEAIPSWEERKVLETYIKDGRLDSLPTRPRHLIIVLRHFIPHFRERFRYSEDEVNRILSPYSRDFALLRDLMVKHRLLSIKDGFYSRR